MNNLLQDLIRLQSIEFEESAEKNTEAVTAELRAKIPAQILGHYDRLVVKGKKGVTGVRGKVCTGCHMQVPLATIMTLKHGTDIQLCENCGRYLYLLEEAGTEAAESDAAPRPARKIRRPRKTLQKV